MRMRALLWTLTPLYYAILWWLAPEGGVMLAWTTILAGVLGAGGSVAGGILGQPKTPTPRDARYVPTADPLLGALSFESLAGLGFLDPSLLSSPIERFQATLEGLGIHRKNLARISGVAAQIASDAAAGKDQREILRRAQQHPDFARFAGILPRFAEYADLGELVEAQISHRLTTQSLERQLGPVAKDVMASRAAGLSKISRMVSDFPTASEADLSRLTDESRASILRDLDKTESELVERSLQEANVGRYNPAGVLGRIREQTTRARSNVELDAITHAAQLLSLRQGLASQSIGALQGALQPGTTNALNTTQVRQGGAATSANISAAQNDAFAQLAAATNAQRAGTLGQGVQGAFTNLGQGVANAGASYQSNQQFQQLLGLLQSKTPGAGGQPSTQDIIAALMAGQF